jgi:hypothetical protein
MKPSAVKQRLQTKLVPPIQTLPERMKEFCAREFERLGIRPDKTPKPPSKHVIGYLHNHPEELSRWA